MALAGAKLELPLTGRQIPLITDPWAKPELGSGCVKITPAHDPNDYDVWQRHLEIGAINILNPDGTLNDSVPEPYRGLDREKARDAVEADLNAAGLIVEKEDREVELAHSDRSKTPIEPLLADQWFVKMDELAQSAMDAVTSGRVKIIPDRYAKSYLDWLSEKRDWPIGRQLWWGHRIPVWYRLWIRPVAQTPPDSFAQTPPDSFTVPWELSILTEEENKHIKIQLISREKDGSVWLGICVQPGYPEIEKKLLEDGAKQDEGVLDTWFSSALWPHSTLGWPEQTEELKYYYPTSVLITSRDIITLWVARWS